MRSAVRARDIGAVLTVNVFRVLWQACLAGSHWEGEPGPLPQQRIRPAWHTCSRGATSRPRWLPQQGTSWRCSLASQVTDYAPCGADQELLYLTRCRPNLGGHQPLCGSCSRSSNSIKLGRRCFRTGGASSSFSRGAHRHEGKLCRLLSITFYLRASTLVCRLNHLLLRQLQPGTVVAAVRTAVCCKVVGWPPLWRGCAPTSPHSWHVSR
jgi:hypothetical protein